MVKLNEPGEKFSLGRIVATRNAVETIPNPEILRAICRHVRGDWGDVCPEDHESNEQALIEGARLLSVYHTPQGVKFWIITEWDRSVTTVLLPEDY